MAAIKTPSLASIRKKRLQVLLKRYESGQAKRSELDELREAGVLESGATCDSQISLANHLERHFSGKLAIHFTQQLVSNWQRGVNLPEGCPAPPPKKGLRYSVPAWIVWIEKNIELHFGVNGHSKGVQKTLFQTADEADLQRRIDAAERERIELLAKKGEYQSVEVHRRELQNIGIQLNQAITQFMEKKFADRLIERLKEVELDETTRDKLQAEIKDGAALASDELRAALAETLIAK